MKNITIAVSRGEGLKDIRETLLQNARAYAADIAQQLDVNDVIISISDGDRLVIPETGIGGFAFDTHTVIVHIDPKSEHINKTLTDGLKGSLAHELHHIARMRDPGFGETLLEEMVSEGLATAFEKDITGETPPWATALNKKELEHWRTEAANVWHKKDLNNNEWLYGSDTIPRWRGYSLGYALVRDYLKENPSKAITDLTHTPAKKVVKE